MLWQRSQHLLIWVIAGFDARKDYWLETSQSHVQTRFFLGVLLITVLLTSIHVLNNPISRSDDHASSSCTGSMRLDWPPGQWNWCAVQSRIHNPAMMPTSSPQDTADLSSDECWWRSSQSLRNWKNHPSDSGGNSLLIFNEAATAASTDYKGQLLSLSFFISW